LREAKLTIAEPGGMVWWPNERPPAHPSLLALQAGEPTELALLDPGREGLDLLGTRDRHARPSWLAPLGDRPETTPPRAVAPRTPDGTRERAGAAAATGTRDGVAQPTGTRDGVASVDIPKAELDRLPLWIQAAVRLGARFIRVAASGIPPATAWL